MRAEFTKAVRLAAWKRSNGACRSCTAKLFPGNVEYHHDLECTFGGTADLDNCVVLCRGCHRAITNKRAKVIAKSNAEREKHLGIKKPRTIRAWRRFDGTAVYAKAER